MKTSNRFFLGLVLFLSLTTLLAQPQVVWYQVTASDYCAFLNDVAKDDHNFLYDDKMGTDAQTTYIERVGVPGNYHYEVIDGRENEPITFIDEKKAAAYAAWSQRETKLLSSTACNKADFEVVASSSPILSLAVTSTSTSNFNSVWAYATGLACVAFGFSGMMKSGDVEPAEVRTDQNPTSLLQKFREAVNRPDNEGAENLHITGEESDIVITASTTLSRNKNLNTINYLRTALQEEHSREETESIINEVITPLDLIGERSSRLSTERLHRILARADEISNRRLNSNVLNEAETELVLLSSHPPLEIARPFFSSEYEDEKQHPLFQIFSRIIQRDEVHLSEIYRASNEAAEEAKKAWQMREDARIKKEAAEEAAKRVSQVRERVAAVTTEEALQKNILGSISSNGGKLANFLEKLPAERAKELSSLITIATATVDKINETGAKVITTLTELGEKLVMYRVKADKAAFEHAKCKAPELAVKAQQQEQAAQEAEKMEVLELVQKLKLPTEAIDKASWREWASQFSNEESIVSQLISYGISNPRLVERAIRTAWNERIQFSELSLENLRHGNDAINLKYIHQQLQEAEEKKERAAKNVATAKENLETISQEKQKTAAILQEANDQLDQYVRENKILATETTIRAICNYVASLKQVSESSKNFQEELAHTIEVEAAVRDEVALLEKKYNDLEKTFSKKLSRAKTRVNTDQEEALEILWPEKAQELRDQSYLQAAIQSKLKDGIQKIFSLPPVEQTETRKRPHTTNLIFIKPPLIADEEYERIGRKLLGMEEVETPQQATDPAKARYEALRSQIMEEAAKETEENQHRQNLREELDKFQTKQRGFIQPRMPTKYESLEKECSDHGKKHFTEEMLDDNNSINSSRLTATSSNSKVSIFRWNSRSTSFNDTNSIESCSTSKSNKKSTSSQSTQFTTIIPRKFFTTRKRDDEEARDFDQKEKRWRSLATQAHRKLGLDESSNYLEFWHEADKKIINSKKMAEAKEEYTTHHAERWLAYIDLDQCKTNFELAKKAVEKTKLEQKKLQQGLENDYEVGCYEKRSDEAQQAQDDLTRAENRYSNLVTQSLQESPDQHQPQSSLQKKDEATILFLKKILREYFNDETPEEIRKRKNEEAIHHQAVDIFQKEEPRLAPLEILWREFLELDAAESTTKAEKAAKCYDDDPTAWEDLTSKERMGYHIKIKIRNWTQNNNREKEITKIIKQAKGFDKKTAKKFKNHLNRLEELEKERQAAIQMAIFVLEQDELKRAASLKEFELQAISACQKAHQQNQQGSWFQKNTLLKKKTLEAAQKAVISFSLAKQVETQKKNLIKQELLNFKDRTSIILALQSPWNFKELNNIQTLINRAVIEAKKAGRIIPVGEFFNIDDFIKLSPLHYLNESIEALAIKEKKRSELYTNAAHSAFKAITYIIKAIFCYISGRDHEFLAARYKAEFLLHSTYQLDRSSYSLRKALKNKSNQKIADLWSKNAVLHMRFANKLLSHIFNFSENDINYNLLKETIKSINRLNGVSMLLKEAKKVAISEISIFWARALQQQIEMGLSLDEFNTNLAQLMISLVQQPKESSLP